MILGLIALALLATPLWLAFLHPLLALLLRQFNWDRGPQFNAIMAMLAMNVIWLILALPLATIANVDSFCAFLFYILFTLNGMNVFYFQCINISLTSLHMNILMTVAKAGTITRDALLAQYNDQHMVETRLKRLTALGQIEFTDASQQTVRLKSWLFIILSSPLYVWRWALGLKGER